MQNIKHNTEKGKDLNSFNFSYHRLVALLVHF